jgi:DNA topoisomerase-1
MGRAHELASPAHSARDAGLTYLTPDELGIRRRRAGRGFSYRDSDGRAVTDRATLERIRALAIPPAWREVRIAGRADAHLQAVGLDQRGRRQYRYHPRFREVREAAKFEHLLAFAQALPRLRRRVREDMARPGLGRDKVLATVARLLETTMIRVGGAEYARANGSYGLASLRARHAEVGGGEVRFHFAGKGGKAWRVAVTDRRVTRIVRSCQELPGQALFQYLDEAGERQAIGSDDVNVYLREAGGRDISAKDFRTWWATVLALSALGAAPPWTREAEARSTLAAAVAQVAALLGNTPTICRRCYIHPEVTAAYLQAPLDLPRTRAAGELSGPERAALAFLKARVGAG